MNSFKLGQLFLLGDSCYGKISGLYAQGFHYHTLDFDGNCIRGWQYVLKSNFNLLK